MTILNILKQQEAILLKLNQVLVEEKKHLIHNNGEALTSLIRQKEVFMEELSQQENCLKEATQGRKISEMNQQEISLDLISPVIESIKRLTKEMKRYQEINMMLTMQSIGYAHKLMEIIKAAIKKSDHTYSQTGAYRQNQKMNVAAIDRTV